MSVAIRDDRRAYDAFLERVKSVRSGAVEVGVAPVPHGRGKNAAEIGLIHEYGLGVPQRSFLRSWVDRQGKRIGIMIKNFTREALMGGKPWQEAFGEYAVCGVRQNIRTNLPPPLAEETIERKGHDLALVDTEILIKAITWEVVEK